MQWLSATDQPLLEEATDWSERATAEAPAQAERAILDRTQASMAMQIAAEAPGSRQDMSVTIHNAQTGNPTQITVYANGDGSRIHDIAPSVFGYVASAVSTILSIAAVVTGQEYLYFAAAAIDAAEAGQNFSNGQDVAGVLSLAQAVAAGITGAAGGTTAATPAPVTAQVINAAAQGVGGVYGIVQSAKTGNAAGILAGALEAAAAGATGIGMYEGGQTQAALNAVAAALGTAGIATNMAGDFASGNLGQGLVDSLNLYLPAVAQAYVNAPNLDEAFWAYKGATLAAQFDAAQQIGITFSMLPSNTQTALADVYWHYAQQSNGYLTKTQLWAQITTGNWVAAADNITTWTPVPIARNQVMGNLIMQDIHAGLLSTSGQ